MKPRGLVSGVLGAVLFLIFARIPAVAANPAMVREWAKAWDGGNEDSPSDIALGPDGSVYVAGEVRVKNLLFIVKYSVSSFLPTLTNQKPPRRRISPSSSIQGYPKLNPPNRCMRTGMSCCWPETGSETWPLPRLGFTSLEGEPSHEITNSVYQSNLSVPVYFPLPIRIPNN
jgi:hypothetical protein